MIFELFANRDVIVLVTPEIAEILDNGIVTVWLVVIVVGVVVNVLLEIDFICMVLVVVVVIIAVGALVGGVAVIWFVTDGVLGVWVVGEVVVVTFIGM